MLGLIVLAVVSSVARGRFNLAEIVVTAGLVWLQGAILRRRSFVTVTGKAYRPRTLELGRVRYLLAAAAWAYVAASVILPVGTLLWAALVNFITIDARRSSDIIQRKLRGNIGDFLRHKGARNGRPAMPAAQTVNLTPSARELASATRRWT